MLVHCKLPPGIKFTSTHLYTSVERSTMRVILKVSRSKDTTQWPQQVCLYLNPDRSIQSEGHFNLEQGRLNSWQKYLQWYILTLSNTNTWSMEKHMLYLNDSYKSCHYLVNCRHKTQFQLIPFHSHSNYFSLHCQIIQVYERIYVGTYVGYEIVHIFELFHILHIFSLLTGDMNSTNWPRSQCVAS